MSVPQNDPPKKLVFNGALLKAFIEGRLEPAVEQKVAAYLDSRPELLTKITSTSGDGFLNRLKSARLQSVSLIENNVAITQNGVAAEGKLALETASPSSPASPVPTALANYAGYQITKELGRGGMGVVYLAKNVQMDRLEVLKVLNERLLEHEGAKERFLREVRAVSKLNHPNIVTSYSILPLDRLMVFAMEYVHGMDLHKFIQKHKPLPIALVCSFARQLALGLQHAHDKGLVHRDIKPSNAIVYKADGQLQLKILDFGLAKATSEKKSDGLTQDGTMLGTPEYMSPEQTLNASKADIRADIYSLGCTLYAMLTSSPPFTGTHGEIMMAHAQREATTVNLRRPEVPAELASVISRMMAKDVSKRYQVPSEVIAALQPFLRKSYGASKDQATIPTESPGTVNDLGASDRETSVDKAREMSLDYASVEKQALSLQEMLNRPAPAATQLRPSKKATKGKSSKNGWIGGLVVSAFMLPIILWMSGVLSVKTPDGTIVFEKLPKDADVFVDGNKVQVTWNDGKEKAQVSVVPGTHQVKVIAGERTSAGERVTISDGEKQTLAVRWVFEQLSPKPNQDSSSTNPTKNTSPRKTTNEIASLLNRQLLQNPSCEDAIVRDGNIPGWLTVRGGWQTREGDPNPRQGKHYFHAKPSDKAELSQRVDVAELETLTERGLIQMNFQCCLRGWRNPYDTAEVVVEMHSQTGSILDSFTSGPTRNTNRWEVFEKTMILPIGTHSLDVRLISERHEGKNNDGYFDDLRLELEQLDAQTITAAGMGVDNSNKNSLQIGSISSEGFDPLWNGKDMTGWNFPFGRGTYTVKDGVLDAMYSRTNYQAIVTDRDDFSDFHAKWQMKIDGSSPGGNSNIQFFLRTKQSENDLKGWHFALGGKRAASAGVAGMGDFHLKTGGTPTTQPLKAEPGKPENDLIVTGESLPAMSRDEWHAVEFLARGNRIDMIVDEKLVTSVVDSLDRISTGQLALRAQWDTRIEFKSIEIREFEDVESAINYADAYLKSLPAPSRPIVAKSTAPWLPIFLDGKLAKDTSINWTQFSITNGLLTPSTDKDSLLFGMEQLRDFRVRMDYRISDQTEAALILRCPNARKERETGYSIGLGNGEWIYNVNKVFHFIHMSARAKKILDISQKPEATKVTKNEWHLLEVEALENRFSMSIDGKLLYSFEDSEHRAGVVGLQTRKSGIEVRRFEYQAIE